MLEGSRKKQKPFEETDYFNGLQAAVDGGRQMDVGHIMYERYMAWGELKIVLSYRGSDINAKKNDCLRNNCTNAVVWGRHAYMSSVVKRKMNVLEM